MTELDSSTPTIATKRIRSLCQDGYGVYDQYEFREALRLFYQAWLLIPKPQSQFEEAGWVLSAIGDCYFRLELFDQAIESLESALHCPKVCGNPFVHLRLAQCYLDVGVKDLAQEHMCLAQQSNNAEILDGLAPRYLALSEQAISESAVPESAVSKKASAEQCTQEQTA